jgi:hypothetical protein
VALAIMSIAVTPGLVLASDIFSDVPNSNAFHGPIGAIARAGITTGCGGGMYCPANDVTREQMAGFMHRGFGRAAEDSVFGLGFSTAPTTVMSLSITPGLPSTAVAGAKNFIVANGAVNLYVPTPSGCVCYYEVHLTIDGIQFSSDAFVTVAASGAQVVSVPVAGVAEVDDSGAHAIGVVVDQYIGSSNTTAYGNLTAHTTPFGAHGTNVLPFAGGDSETPRPGE